MSRPLHRRDAILQIGGTVAAVLAAPTYAQTRTLRIGTTFDNSAVEKANGSGTFQGASAYFNALNKAGGINGAKVELVMADDQFKPELAKSNARPLPPTSLCLQF